MYTQILAGLFLIPLGMSTMMRGSDGLNHGAYGAGEAGTMAISGAGMVLAGVGLLLGLVVASVPALAALIAATVIWLRQRRRALGHMPRLTDMAGRAIWTSAIVALIVVGWQ